MSQEPLSNDPERTQRNEVKIAISLINNGMRYHLPDMVRKGLIMLIRLAPVEKTPSLTGLRNTFIKRIAGEKRKDA